jgi:hypothetical protein
MKLDLDKLRESIQAEVDEKNKEDSERSNNNVPLIYLGSNGKIRVKILYNTKSNTVQRKIIRHTEGGKKIACLSMFDEECPICSAIRTVEDMNGKECGVWNEHHSKIRGICYAIIVDFEPSVFKDRDNPPKKGDMVILMYPQSIYNELNKIFVEAGDHLESLLVDNNGKTIEIKREKNGKEPPKYTVNVYPYGDEKIKETDEEFDTLLDSVPDLNETLVHKNLTDDDLSTSKAASETIIAQYTKGDVLDPNGDRSQVDKGHDTSNDVASVAPSTREPAFSTTFL